MSPRASATRALWLALSMSGCGPGGLGSGNFGSVGDEVAGEGGAADVGSADDPDEIGGEGTGEGSGGEESASTSAGESESDIGEGESGGGTQTSGGEGTDTDSGEVGEGLDDPDEGLDTWGVPPDVTNEPCDPLAQDCFPTHKCVPFASVEGSNFLDADKCMPILGDKVWGEPCTLSDFNEAQDDCDGEGFCWNLEWVEGELQGTCVPFCVGTPQDLVCPAGWACLFSGAVSLCAKQCDPLVQDCPLDYGCYWTGNAFDCSLVATPAGDLEACDDYNDCLAGFGCVDPALVPSCVGDDPGCCTPFCELGGAEVCAGPRECVAFFAQDEAPPGYESTGICVLP
ncbi:hypothetical protein G6O69_34120 [Pseudenhygromyxa sp. WMMC2535]|uniref:hypothetical protein n=1 Tax=Pseudenhygromyxa sp. WMMC2535 TaxID=2712867 RepID=UPI00155269A0|nr:hypothetical protein [Pseudenhygromyxa sp. WMMC2535]NVB42908.1 hypothetical protein [Pseudenhygromyxa sp. WMMC2535]